MAIFRHFIYIYIYIYNLRKCCGDNSLLVIPLGSKLFFDIFEGSHGGYLLELALIHHQAQKAFIKRKLANSMSELLLKERF